MGRTAWQDPSGVEAWWLTVKVKDDEAVRAVVLSDVQDKPLCSLFRRDSRDSCRRGARAWRWALLACGVAALGRRSRRRLSLADASASVGLFAVCGVGWVGW